LVSFLDEKGIPAPVERALIKPPCSRVGPASDAERQEIIQNAVIYGHYEKQVDRESAYEILKGRAVQAAQPTTESANTGNSGFDWGGVLDGVTGSGSGRGRQGVLETAAKSVARSIGQEVGRQIIRGVLGSLLGGGRRR